MCIYIHVCAFVNSIIRSPLSSVLDVAQAVVAEIIQLCGEVALLASPVVCNSSPEGFLPGAKVCKGMLLCSNP